MASLSEWKRRATRATSGDMVWDILADWEQERDELRRFIERYARHTVFCSSPLQSCECGYQEGKVSLMRKLEGEWISSCCGRPAIAETFQEAYVSSVDGKHVDAMGICSGCRERTHFECPEGE